MTLAALVAGLAAILVVGRMAVNATSTDTPIERFVAVEHKQTERWRAYCQLLGVRPDRPRPSQWRVLDTEPSRRGAGPQLESSMADIKAALSDLHA